MPKNTMSLPIVLQTPEPDAHISVQAAETELIVAMGFKIRRRRNGWLFRNGRIQLQSLTPAFGFPFTQPFLHRAHALIEIPVDFLWVVDGFPDKVRIGFGFDVRIVCIRIRCGSQEPDDESDSDGLSGCYDHSESNQMVHGMPPILARTKISNAEGNEPGILAGFPAP